MAKTPCQEKKQQIGWAAMWWDLMVLQIWIIVLLKFWATMADLLPQIAMPLLVLHKNSDSCSKCLVWKCMLWIPCWLSHLSPRHHVLGPPLRPHWCLSRQVEHHHKPRLRLLSGSLQCPGCRLCHQCPDCHLCLHCHLCRLCPLWRHQRARISKLIWTPEP